MCGFIQSPGRSAEHTLPAEEYLQETDVLFAADLTANPDAVEEVSQILRELDPSPAPVI
jgi:hypothetical protein